MPQEMQCLLVDRNDAGQIESRLTHQPIRSLNDGDVLIEVEASSLNYKDAMAATGHGGIVKNFPHVPGIDAVGEVIESRDERYSQGATVIATGHEIGVEQWGGWATHLATMADWLVPLPSGLSSEEAMILGTAGFTAAQCVHALLHHGCRPESGQVVVSGATGGVGSLSVMLLARLGFDVLAVTGKSDRHDWLKQMGANAVTGRETLGDDSNRPLLKGEFAAGIDTVGGAVLATMLKKIRHRGCVSCCGVAGGAELPTTVFPFILRGITLHGIDSAWCPDDLRRQIWSKLAGDWKLENLSDVKVDLALTDIGDAVSKMLGGKFAGRGVVHVNS